MRRPTATALPLPLALVLLCALPCAHPGVPPAAAAANPPAAAAALAADTPDTLRRAWHRCVRRAYSGQPASLDRHAAQRAALQACRTEEDATVAAVLADEGASGRTPASLTSRARAWMASVAGYVVDPVTAWLGGLGR